MRARLQDWQPRLREVLALYTAGTFSRGTFDCGTLWADAVLAVTGEDRLACIRGKYTTKKGALITLRGLEVGTAAALADKLFVPCRATLLQRGDLAAAPAALKNPLTAPAIVVGTHAVTMSETEGLVYYPLQLISHGWAV